jgi:hypothetical protein
MPDECSGRDYEIDGPATKGFLLWECPHDHASTGDHHLIPTAEIVDFSNDLGGWYRAPGCPREAAAAAARRTKTHANGHSLWPLV